MYPPLAHFRSRISQPLHGRRVAAPESSSPPRAPEHQAGHVRFLHWRFAATTARRPKSMPRASERWNARTTRSQPRAGLPRQSPREQRENDRNLIGSSSRNAGLPQAEDSMQFMRNAESQQFRAAARGSPLESAGSAAGVAEFAGRHDFTRRSGARNRLRDFWLCLAHAGTI